MVGQAVGGLVTGLLVGYLLGKDGKPTQAMVICPPGPNGRPVSPDALGLCPVPSPSSSSPGLMVPPQEQIEDYNEQLGKAIRAFTDSATEYLETLLDARLVTRVLIIVNGSQNQAVTIQAVGHTINSANDANGLQNIGDSITLAASGDRVSFGIYLPTDWFPWLGVTITAGSTAPTSGEVQVSAHGQRWRQFNNQRQF